jgi:hypothetical protein
MSDGDHGGAMRELEQARLDAAARAAREEAGSPPVPRRVPDARPPPIQRAAPEGPKLTREVLLNGTVVTTNVTPPAPQPPSEGYRPFSSRSPFGRPVRTLKRGTGRPVG